MAVGDFQKQTGTWRNRSDADFNAQTSVDLEAALFALWEDKLHELDQHLAANPRATLLPLGIPGVVSDNGGAGANGLGLPVPFDGYIRTIAAELQVPATGDSVVVNILRDGANVKTLTFQVGNSFPDETLTGLNIPYVYGEKYALGVPAGGADSGGSAAALGVGLEFVAS